MKHLAPGDRPREKLDRRGSATLGDNELLAVLIGHGTARTNALDVANRLLLAAGGLHGLTRISADELASVPGIGAALAFRILAAIELGRRTLTRPLVLKRQITSAQEAAALLLPDHGAHPVERFGVLLLDSRLRMLRTVVISSGSTDTAVADPRDVFRPAIAAGASVVVLFHNHPSGDPTPSREDVALTRRMVQAGAIVGIDVMDHLVLADAHFVSVRKAGGF